MVHPINDGAENAGDVVERMLKISDNALQDVAFILFIVGSLLYGVKECLCKVTQPG